MLEYIRIACGVPEVKAGDISHNVRKICAYMKMADEEGADILLLPELSLTGYSCGDLFLQDSLWNAVKAGMKEILKYADGFPALHTVVGLPLRLNGKMLNCAAMVKGGKLRGLVPKSYLWGEESRWFVSGMDLKETAAGLDVFGDPEIGFVSLGTDLLFDIGDGAVVGIEICEDFNAPIPPSTLLALNGANVILNPSASPEMAGKQTVRRERAKTQSGACKCIYAYCSAGWTESTADTVFSGHSIIAQNNVLLKENECIPAVGYLMVQDCDLGAVNAQRRKNPTFRTAAARYGSREYLLEPMLGDGKLRSDGSLYPLQKLPFVPSEEEQCQTYCREIFRLQVTGLRRRLETTGACPVVGISGGLDSTLALLVCVEAVKQMGRPVSDVQALTMPCFGTTERTYRNSRQLMELLGTTCREVNIRRAVLEHFVDIGQDPGVHDATFENAQARERTQVLMDYAGRAGGIVVGTGDLSELALGWCTYNGDQMSMYAVNASIPKTLLRQVLETLAREPEYAVCKGVLRDILDTPISPELLPPDARGSIGQQTEGLVGPYALHDFFLYHMLQSGFAPGKIYAMACRAFRGEFEPDTVKKWLLVFYKRFFAQQFKRSAMPEGVKVQLLSLGPRGDWSMPGDITGRIWLEEIEQL